MTRVLGAIYSYGMPGNYCNSELYRRLAFCCKDVMILVMFDSQINCLVICTQFCCCCTG